MLSFRHLSLSAATIALTASMGWGAYMTSFENPPFIANQSPNGIDGWATSGSGVTVTTAEHSAGTQSVSIPHASGATGIHRTFSTAETNAVDNTLSFAFKPAADTTAGDSVAWFYAYIGDDANNDLGHVGLYLRNAQSGSTDLSIKYTINGGAAQYATGISAGVWNNDQWNTGQFKFNTDQTVDLIVNGTTVLSNLSIKRDSSTTATRLTQFAAYSQTPALFIDDVKVVPEPAALGAIFVGGLLLLRRGK